MAGGLRAGGSGALLPGLLQDVGMPVLPADALFSAPAPFLSGLLLPFVDGSGYGAGDAPALGLDGEGDSVGFRHGGLLPAHAEGAG